MITNASVCILNMPATISIKNIGQDFRVILSDKEKKWKRATQPEIESRRLALVNEICKRNSISKPIRKVMESRIPYFLFILSRSTYTITQLPIA